jgi:hypothetical protein
MKHREIAIIAAVGLLLISIIAGGLYLQETVHADRETIQRIEKGMTYAEVVDLLRVMYDRSYRGEHESTDEDVANMENGESVSFVCDWRIAFTREMFCVGFDEDEAVVATLVKSQ